MRGTRYLETEISSAYANQRQFDLHRLKLEKIAMEERNPFRGRGGTSNSPLARKISGSPINKSSLNYSMRNSGSLLKSQNKHGGFLNTSVRVDDSNIVPEEEGDQSRTDLSQQYTPANVGEKTGENNRPS